MNAMMKLPDRQKMTASTRPGEKVWLSAAREVHASRAAANGSCGKGRK